MILPATTTPEALAKRLNWSPRRVRDLARRIGACRILGNPDDPHRGRRPRNYGGDETMPLKSTNEVTSGITVRPLPSGDYAALRALRTKKQRPGSRQRLKTARGNVVSTVAFLARI